MQRWQMAPAALSASRRGIVKRVPGWHGMSCAPWQGGYSVVTVWQCGHSLASPKHMCLLWSEYWKNCAHTVM